MDGTAQNGIAGAIPEPSTPMPQTTAPVIEPPSVAPVLSQSFPNPTQPQQPLQSMQPETTTPITPSQMAPAVEPPTYANQPTMESAVPASPIPETATSFTPPTAQPQPMMQQQMPEQPMQPQSVPESLPPTQPEVFIPHGSHGSKKILLFLGIFLLLLILAGGGYYLFSNKLLPFQSLTVPALPQNTAPAVAVQPSATLTPPSPTPDLTASWIKYSYSLVSLKLPPEWREAAKTNPVQLVNYSATQSASKVFNPVKDAGKLKIEILSKNSSLDLTTYVLQKKPSPVGASVASTPTTLVTPTSTPSATTTPATWNQTSLTLDGQPAIKVKTASSGFTVYVKDPLQPVILTVTFEDDFDSFVDLSNQILGTWQFADLHQASLSPTAAPSPAACGGTARTKCATGFICQTPAGSASTSATSTGVCVKQ